MNFEKAHQELLSGKKIRRKGWEPLMHLVLIDEKITAFKGEHSDFPGHLSMLLSNAWQTIDGDEKAMTFCQALDELKNKKRVRNDSWPGHIFIFLDGEKLAICKPVEYDFMPSFKDFCSQDWETMK